MTILIVGLGSMGNRRLKLLRQNYPEYNIAGVEFSVERRYNVSKEFNIKCYSSTKDAIKSEKIDAAFVCTPPATHHNVILELVKNKINVFTELNLINKGYYELLCEAEKNNVIIFMSSTMLYRKETQYIREAVQAQKKPLQYIYHVGQYLPDWHPWESYKNFFVGEKATNGCREIFAIQLPWILKSFGKLNQEPFVSKSKITNLEINYPDSYLVSMEHITGHRGTIIVDVVSRKATTYMEIVGEDLYITWDGTPTGLKRYNTESKTLDEVKLYNSFEQNTNYAKNIIEDAYKEEINYFISALNHENKMAPYSLEDDEITLSIIDMIEG